MRAAAPIPVLSGWDDLRQGDGSSALILLLALLFLLFSGMSVVGLCLLGMGEREGWEEGGCGSFNPFTLRGDYKTPKLWGKGEKSRGSLIQRNMAHWYISCLTEMLERSLWACALNQEQMGLNSGCTAGTRRGR